MSSAPGTPAAPDKPAGDKPTFENSIRGLADIVEKLERGDLPLEEALRLFEEGVRLSRACQSELDAAEKKVEELLAVTDDGAAVTRELNGS